MTATIGRLPDDPAPMMLRHLPLLLAVLAPSFALAADPYVERQLDGLGYAYEIDEDGDYKMVFDLADGRTQIVYVRSPVESFGSLRVREIWSPGFVVEGNAFPAAVANRLLSDSNGAKVGAWVRQGSTAMYVVKIDASASAEQLSDAISAAITTADKLEQELTLGKDAF